MTPPKLTPVQSSNISALGYKDGMWVRFNGGTLYRYPEVPMDRFQEAFQVESVGRWFAQNIRGKYQHEQVDA